MNESQDSFQRFMFGEMNKDAARRRKEAAIKEAAASDRALKEQIASRSTEEQLAAIDELVADGQRKGLPITRELVLYAMRPVHRKATP
jgi:hypothetical protein